MIRAAPILSCEVTDMKKGCSIGVFVLGLVMLCASAAITVLGAVGMGRRAR